MANPWMKHGVSTRLPSTPDMNADEILDVSTCLTSIINDLPDSALAELLGGYQNDVDKLFHSMVTTAQEMVNNSRYKVELANVDYLPRVYTSYDESLKKLSYNYFKISMLPGFTMGWRNIEWGNLIQLYPYSCFRCQRGSGKCFAKGTKVVMFDGSLKNIEDIRIGDKLMGVDNTVRTVLSLHTGVDDLYEVEQKQNLNYVVNSKHDLYFDKHKNKKTIDKNGRSITGTDWDINAVDTIRVTAEEFHKKSKTYKSESFGKRVNGWDLPERELPFEPYWLGLWLGDGNKQGVQVYNIDEEVADYVKGYAERLGMRYSHEYCYKGGYFITHSMVGNYGGDARFNKNKIYELLKEHKLFDNKHIPDIYLRSSRKQRLELLAGLIDSDGSVNKNDKGEKVSYHISQKKEDLVHQIQLLAWSLGFRCNMSKHFYTDFPNTWIYSIYISGFVSEIPCKIERKKILNFKPKKLPSRAGLDIKYVGVGEYYGFTCDKDHLFLLSDGTIVSNSYEFCKAYILWRLYSYTPPTSFLNDTVRNRNLKETCLITNEGRLGRLHLDKIEEEIRSNDLLHEKLLTKGVQGLGKDPMRTKNGAIVHLRSRDSFIRGLHVGGVVLDDFLDKSCIYSAEQRAKFHEVFYAEIMNIVEPKGDLKVVGTPFHEADLYNDIDQDPAFKSFIYPGIFPDGEILAPDRFDFEKLMELRESLGSMVFSREILVIPVSDSSTIFPWDYLQRAFIGMENVSLVENIESYPVKLERVAVGCDFAISGNIGADYSVFTVWGVDSMKRYHLLYVWRKQGASHLEQVNQVVWINNVFKPNIIWAEGNNFQKVIIDLIKERGIINIEPFITSGSNKKDLYSGLPSLAALFERGDIKIPYKVGKSKEIAEWLCGEFNSVTFTDKGKLESAGQHDDGAMSSFIGISALREDVGSQFRVSLI